MGNTIKGLTVEINGNVSPLNKALGEVNSKSKDLQNELKSVEKLLKFDPSNTELLVQKQTLLAQSVGAAKEKLDTLKIAFEQAQQKLANGDIGEDQFRALQREVITAEQKLSSLTAQETDLKQETNKAGAATKDLGDDFGKAERKALSFGDVLKANLISDAVVGGIRAIGSAVAAMAQQFVQLATDALDSADNLKKLSDETGLTTEQLQVMQYQGEDLGVSLDTMTGSMSKMINNMSSAKAGTGTAAEAFKTLGISVTDSNGNLRDSNVVYAETLAALGGVANETERTAIAQDIFGKSAVELNPLIKAGTEGLAELEAQAYATGAVMSSDTVNALDSLGDSLDHMKQSITTAAGTFVAQFAPALQEVSQGLTGLLSGTVSADDFIASISELINQIATTIVGMVPQILQAGSSILTTLIKGLLTSLPSLIPAVTSIILELTTTLIEMLPQIIEAGLQIILSLALGLADALPELIPTIVDVVLQIVETLIDNIDLLIDAAIEIILALAQGLIDSLPKLIEKLPEIIIKIVKAIIENAPKMLDAAVELISMLSEGLWNGFKDIMGKLGGWIKTNILDPIGEKVSEFADMGGNLIKGIWDGISNKAEWLWNKVSGFFTSLTDRIKDFFGIHSPSRLFRDEIGAMMAQGIGVGFEGEMANVAKQMNNSIPTDFETNIGYATANASDIIPNKSASTATSTSDSIAAVLADGLASIGNVIYDAIPKETVFNVNGEKFAVATWGDFETTAENKNKIFGASREAIASIARSVT